MPQLYIFLLALLAISIIVFRRHTIFSRKEKEDFHKEVATQVDESRKIQHQEVGKRYRDEFSEQQKTQKFDLNRYKEEIRKADMAIAKKQWRDAKRYLIQAISLGKEELPVSLKLAKVYLESGDIRKAETLFRRLIEIEPRNPEVYENLAKILTKKKNYKEAIQAYVRAVEIDQSDDKKFIALGKLYYLLMRYSLAGECFRRAAELKPREVEYMFLLADACQLDEDFENALFSYEKILTIEPYNERAKGASYDVRVKINELNTFFDNKPTVKI
jgi:tetratricopeptide (TPR) repeat protein